MPDTRARIRRHVRETPGVHFNRVGRDLDIATGQAQYHLRRLVRDGEIAVERIGGRAHYFDPAFDPWERRTVAFLRRETARGSSFGSTPTARLGRRRSRTSSTSHAAPVSWHVSNLVESGIEKSDERPMHLSLAFPERTATLFDEVSPSLPDRIVDRFVRTVDSLFEWGVAPLADSSSRRRVRRSHQIR